jgi:hypothetical protein
VKLVDEIYPSADGSLVVAARTKHGHVVLYVLSDAEVAEADRSGGGGMTIWLREKFGVHYLGKFRATHKEVSP